MTEDSHSSSNQAGRRFMWRAMTSLLISLSFLVLVITGIILFVSPPGRVANWTNWTMLGLRKHDWTGLHIWFGILFLLVAVFHVIFNWRPLLSYFKDRLTRRVGFRWEWLAALVVCGAVFAGTRAGLPPFSSVLAFNEAVKESWDKSNERAPIPHAELLTLAELADKAGVNLAVATERLTTGGMTGIGPGAVVRELADQNGRSAQEVYQMMTARSRTPGGQSARGEAGRGHGGGGGPGWKTLKDYCASESIDLDAALARLKGKGISASADLTLREIAVNNGYSRPYELLDVIAGDQK